MNGAFGKVPSKADFARLGYSDGQTRSFEGWLDEASSRMREVGVELPDTVVNFIMHEAGDPRVMVGAMRASRDSVGRRFPLAIFSVLEWSVFQHRWSGLPFALSPMLEATSELLREASALSLEALRHRVEALWSPDGGDIQRTDTVCRDVLAGTVWTAPVARTLGSAETLAKAAYAFRTMKASLALPNGAFECPIQVDVDLFFWLELARSLGTNDALTVVWTEEPTPRVIVSVGRPSIQLLVAISDPRREIQQIWPLVTTRPIALEQAWTALGPTLEAVGEGTLDVLFRSLAQSRDL